MRIEYKPAFGRSLKTLDFQERERAKSTTGKVIDFYTTGEKTPGLGLVHLRGDFWEARAGIKTRILYRWRTDLIEFVLAGNHDDVRRFLKRL